MSPSRKSGTSISSRKAPRAVALYRSKVTRAHDCSPSRTCSQKHETLPFANKNETSADFKLGSHSGMPKHSSRVITADREGRIGVRRDKPYERPAEPVLHGYDGFLCLSDSSEDSDKDDSVKRGFASYIPSGDCCEGSVEPDHHSCDQLAHYRQPSAICSVSHHYCGQPADCLLSRCDYSAKTTLYPFGNGDPMYISETNGLNGPAFESQLSILYSANFTVDPEPEPLFDPESPSPLTINPSNFLPNSLIDQSMCEYMDIIRNYQYPFGDKATIQKMIWDGVVSHMPSQEAVYLLSQNYFKQQRDRTVSLLEDDSVQHRIANLKSMLTVTKTADDALAALHIVSLYLLNGGRGKWSEFLGLACSYTISVLENPHYFGNHPEALEGASAKDEFVVKTTIWFDVLASITMQKPPILLKYIRALFDPRQSWSGFQRTYSMMSPMGCENAVVWALAETSYLSYWKAQQMEAGTLSIRQLVNLVQEIEPYLQPGPHPIQPQATIEDWSRYVASEVFRTSTKLFLKSVEAGDYPQVQEIRECIQDTLAAIRDFSLNRPGEVVRQSVFGIFMCGILSESEDVLKSVELHMMWHSSGEESSTMVSDLLRRFWDERRMQPAGQPVRWRQLLSNEGILLA